MKDIESQDFRFREGYNQYNPLNSLQVSKHIIEILVIGDSQTGKTSLTKIVTHKGYPKNIAPPKNIEKTQGCELRVALKRLPTSKYLLKMMDLSGDKAQRSYLDIYLSRFKMDAIIFCFDVTNLKTLDNIRKWIQRMLQKGNAEQENSLDTDTSDFSRQNSITVQEEQDCLISYQNYNGIPDLLQKPFLFVGCKMDLIPMDKHEYIRQQVQEKVIQLSNQMQSIYQRSKSFILLSTTKPTMYCDEYETLEKCITRIYEKKDLEEFLVREKIQSKMIKLNDSFWKQKPWSTNFTLLGVYWHSFWQRLFCKKHKR